MLDTFPSSAGRVTTNLILVIFNYFIRSTCEVCRYKAPKLVHEKVFHSAYILFFATVRKWPDPTTMFQDPSFLTSVRWGALPMTVCVSVCVFVCSGTVEERCHSVVRPEGVKETSHPGHQPAGSHPVRAPHHDGGSQSIYHQVRMLF